MHFEKELEPEDTPEQLQLMKTQDLKYIITKRTQEQRKIEKLQSQLHLASVEHNIPNKHIYFGKKEKKADLDKQRLDKLSEMELPDVDVEVLEVLLYSKFNIILNVNSISNVFVEICQNSFILVQ